jgi:hypothetical protein
MVLNPVCILDDWKVVNKKAFEELRNRFMSSHRRESKSLKDKNYYSQEMNQQRRFDQGQSLLSGLESNS